MYSTYRSMGQRSLSDTKINSKCIIGLNVMLDTIKLLEESIGRVLIDVNHRNLL